MHTIKGKKYKIVKPNYWGCGDIQLCITLKATGKRLVIELLQKPTGYEPVTYLEKGEGGGAFHLRNKR